jgi:hypothetical protein
MVFQATIPTVVALVFASESWSVAGSQTAFLSAAIGLLSSLVIFYPMARRGVLRARGLLTGGLFYATYLGYVITVVAREPV